MKQCTGTLIVKPMLAKTHSFCCGYKSSIMYCSQSSFKTVSPVSKLHSASIASTQPICNLVIKSITDIIVKLNLLQYFFFGSYSTLSCNLLSLTPLSSQLLLYWKCSRITITSLHHYHQNLAIHYNCAMYIICNHP